MENNEKMKAIYNKLNENRPNGYKINELVSFSYPLIKAKIGALVNKMPDGSLVNVYNVILNAVDMGYDTTDRLFDFLGLGMTDEFMRNELHYLRDKGYLDLVSNKWYVSDMGREFLENHEVMRVEEKVDYDVFVDGITGDFLSAKDRQTGERLSKWLEIGNDIAEKLKDKTWVGSKYHELSDIYKSDSEGKTYLISSDDSLRGRKESWMNYWFIEYVPEDKDGDNDPFLEVRDENLEKNKRLTNMFNEMHDVYINALSDSDRVLVPSLLEDLECDDPQQIIYEDDNIEPVANSDKSHSVEELTIWETKEKFLEALNTVKEKILIESPWIRKATNEYLPLFKKLLKDGKKLVILYGVDQYAEHDEETLNKLKKLANEYSHNFMLVDLPEHLYYSGIRGTHRKIMIKDNEYFISGSFNFLSFGRNQHQRVANEESYLIRSGVEKKWKSIMEEYEIECDF